MNHVTKMLLLVKELQSDTEYNNDFFFFSESPQWISFSDLAQNSFSSGIYHKPDLSTKSIHKLYLLLTPFAT